MRSSTKSSLILALAALLMIIGSAASADPVEDAKLGIKREKNSFFSQFDFSVDWAVHTDLNDPVKPRSYSHMLSLNVSHEFMEKYTGFINAGLEFNTFDTTVYRTNSTDDYFTPGDITVGALTNYKLNDSNSVTVTVAEDILTSTDSRYFGYRSVTGARAIFSTHLYGSWLRLQNSVGANYILNRYRFAPVSSGGLRVGDVNPDGIVDYSVGPMFKIIKGLNLSANLSLRGFHYLDGTDTFGFGNSFTTSYTMGNWTLWAKYINKGWAERGETNLWFADTYRRLTWAGASVNF